MEAEVFPAVAERGLGRVGVEEYVKPKLTKESLVSLYLVGKVVVVVLHLASLAQ